VFLECHSHFTHNHPAMRIANPIQTQLTTRYLLAWSQTALVPREIAQLARYPLLPIALLEFIDRYRAPGTVECLQQLRDISMPESSGTISGPIASSKVGAPHRARRERILQSAVRARARVTCRGWKPQRKRQCSGSNSKSSSNCQPCIGVGIFNPAPLKTAAGRRAHNRVWKTDAEPEAQTGWHSINLLEPCGCQFCG